MDRFSKEKQLLKEGTLIVTVLLIVGVFANNSNIENVGGGEDAINVLNALNAISNVAFFFAGLIICLMLLGGVIMLKFPPDNPVSKIEQQFNSLREKVKKVQVFYKKVAPQLEQELKAFEYLNAKITEAYNNPNRTEGYEWFKTEFLHELQLLEVIYENLDERASAAIIESTNELIRCLDDKSMAETEQLITEIKSELAIFKEVRK